MHIYLNVARTVVVVQRAATTKVGEDIIAADLIKLLDSGGLRVWLAYVAPVTEAVVHLLQVVAVTFGVQLTHKHPRFCRINTGGTHTPLSVQYGIRFHVLTGPCKSAETLSSW